MLKMLAVLISILLSGCARHAVATLQAPTYSNCYVPGEAHGDKLPCVTIDAQ